MTVFPLRASTSLRHELDAMQFLSCAPGRYASPSEVRAQLREAQTVRAGTVAAGLRELGALDLTNPPDLDAEDHWLRLVLPDEFAEGEQVLCIEGIATLADVWVGDAHVLRSDNMFRRHALRLREHRKPGAEVIIRCHALAPVLGQRRPRPRYRTSYVSVQALRFIRTSLLGRMPERCPRLAPVGLTGRVALEARRTFDVERAHVRAALVKGQGELELVLELRALGDSRLPTEAVLVVEGPAANARFVLKAEPASDRASFAGSFVIPDVSPWWPHSHGAQPLSEVRVELMGATLSLGKVGFRTVSLVRGTSGEDFSLFVNGERIFCRGAVWTSSDLVSVGRDALEETLRLVRASGMNMLRVGGTTVYERDAFYERCDELGILVWQDFMFANMDYPLDAAFCEEARAEAREQLARIAHHPCVAVWCGNSEVESQAAMLGQGREVWEHPLFYRDFPALVAELAPGLPYVPSSATGGALPFYPNAGSCHYFGVGGYLRGLDDLRRAQVRFASECLGFANAPRSETIDKFMGGGAPSIQHPRWKAGVPRDPGSGWDYDDVCEHYMRLVFGVDPLEVRRTDPERHLALSRAAVCTVMERAFAEWRRAGSETQGALVWFLKDYALGAGWGVIDGLGFPKAVYYALKRSFANVAVMFTDEGLNGLFAHVINEQAEALEATLELTLYRAGEVMIERVNQGLTLASRTTRALCVDALLSHFVDTSLAYRFGPAGHDLVVARLFVNGEIVSAAFHEPLGQLRALELDLGLHAELVHDALGPCVVVRTRRFAQRVTLEVEGAITDDDAFHLEPGGERRIRFSRLPDKKELRGRVTALNAARVLTLTSGVRS